MFEGVMHIIRTAIITHQITARHALKPVTALAYNHPLQSVMFNTLNNSPSGVFVHWGVYGSGKTTAAIHAGLQLQADRTVIKLHGYDTIPNEDMHTWLRRCIGVPDDTQQISTYFNRPTTIIIDHSDLLAHRNPDDMLALVRSLVQESEETKQFNVLFIVTSWELAIQLQENKCTLLGSPSRWSEDELIELFSKQPEELRNKLSDQQREEQIRTCTLSGTPDFAISTHYIEKNCPRRAAILDSEWRKGTRALVEGRRDEEGRFPDKKGTYHWEDLSLFSGAGQ